MNDIDKPLSSIFLVRSEHLNHHGHLFGGDLMAEIDTLGFCFVKQRFGDRSFVTRAADISFERPARLGDAIVFSAELEHLGTTSVRILVTGTVDGDVISHARMIYVNVDDNGCKKPIDAS